MRILPKNQVEQAKVLDMKREGEQLSELVRKTDEMRQIYSDTKEGYEKYRYETLQTVQREINQKIDERDTLQAEIVQLQEKRKVYLKPIDEEWDRVNYLKSQVDEQKEKNERRMAELQALTYDLTEKQKNLNQAEVHIKELENERITLLEDIQKNKERTDIALAEASELRREAEFWKKETERELTHREKEVLARERDISLKQDFIQRRTEELDLREENLKSRYEQIEKTAERLKQHR